MAQKKKSVKNKYKTPKSFKTWARQHKSLLIIWAMVAAVLIVLLGALVYVRKTYTVHNIYVEGSSYYSDEEIIDRVLSGRFSHNSLYLSFKYRDTSIEDVPFVEKMTVEILSPDSIKIKVYEKAMAGCVQYLGRYMYFDKDGIIVEASQEKVNDVPLVMGLKFDSVVLYKKLPVENDDVFLEILDITQLLGKYNLDAEKIYFDSSYNVYLYFGDVEVELGPQTNINEKIIQLQYILPNLEGKSGVLEMKEYTEDSKNITFRDNTEKTEEEGDLDMENEPSDEAAELGENAENG